MRLLVIDAGNFKLDGGSMFGVVPKSLWQRAIPADENNMCNFKMRCLLVEDGDRLTLIDTGMGNKQPEKWQSYYYRNGEGELKKSIREAGYDITEVTDVILSHLHFDHCGGAVEWDENKEYYRPTFPNAVYWTQSEHYAAALEPNAREVSTFFKENINPLAEAGQLDFIDLKPDSFGENYEFEYVDGHTDKMMMVYIRVKDQKVGFIADTIPTAAHIHVPYVMAYDIAPLKTMAEKEKLLKRASDEEMILFFDHDVETEACISYFDGRKYQAKETGRLHDFLKS